VAARQALDRQPRPGVRAKKSQRDRLIRLAEARPDWALGFADETWWSRLAPPALHAWAEAKRPLRLVERAVASDDPGPKALAAYGLYLPATNEVLLRFVDGRPVSALTTQFLAWCCEKLAARGTAALLLAWDNAGWHISREVRAWVREHNAAVERGEAAVRLVICRLPVKSPWLNPIEPKWVHGKRRAVEPDRLLTAQEVEERACTALGATHEEHLPLPKKVA
jgi:DDE superfamily endonuclease